MAVMHATMQQVSPHTWTFTPPAVTVAPMKGHCRSCRQPVAIERPEAVTLPTGNYVVRGSCAVCGDEVVLIVA